MAQSPRPPGPVRALGPPRGLRSPGTKGPRRVADQIAGGRRKAPGLCAVSASPQTSLGRDGRSKGANEAGPGLHDTARSGPGPDPGPTQAPPRGRAGAQLGPGPRLLIRPFPLLPSPSFTVSTSKTRPQPGPAGPTPRGGSPGARTHRGRTGTRTHSLSSRGHGARFSQPAAVADRG